MRATCFYSNSNFYNFYFSEKIKKSDFRSLIQQIINKCIWYKYIFNSKLKKKQKKHTLQKPIYQTKMVHYNKHIIVPSTNHFIESQSHLFLHRLFLQWLDFSKHLNICGLWMFLFVYFFTLQLYFSWQVIHGVHFSIWSINHIQEACDRLTAHFLRAHLHQKWVNPQGS